MRPSVFVGVPAIVGAWASANVRGWPKSGRPWAARVVPSTCASALVIAGLVAVAQPALLLAAPSLERIEPPGGKQGSEVEVVLGGGELASAQEVFFEEGKLSAVGVESQADGTVKATFRIPAGCQLGPHRLRVRTASGLSDLRVFHVNAVDQIREKEPNDAPTAAMPIDLGCIVWGKIAGEDVDRYKVHLPKGGRISAMIEAVRLEQQMIDPYIDLVDADGFVIASCDDHPLLSQDAALTATVPEEGDYFLRVRESAYAGPNGVYQLHVGTFPIAHVAWPPGGPAGKPLDVEWFGDPSGTFRQKVDLPAADIDGLARVRPVRDGVMSPLPVPFRVTASPVVTVAEPSNEPTEASTAKAPVAIAGRIDGSEDVDWIRVEAPAASKWKISGWGRRLGSPIDLVIAAHRSGAKHERITSNDDTDGPDSSFQVTVPAEGAFLLRVSDFERRGGPEFVYWLDVQPLEPGVSVAVAPATTRTRQRLVVAVPRGNRMALFFNATRTDCSDPTRLDFMGLPRGVTVATAPFAEPAPGGLVVFEAAADAVPGTAIADVSVSRGTGEATQKVGGLRQMTDMVYGDPNRTTYRSLLGDRIAVAVVDEAPVTIELVPPTAPVVRRGLANLKVKVTRAAEFDGRVRLELPFKPPGIGSGVVDVKPDETEVDFPISVTPEAPVNEWQIAMSALLMPPADAAKGPAKKPVSTRAGLGAWIASRPVMLSVVEPLVELAPDKATAELGGETRLVFKVTCQPEFKGTATARLVGLPIGVEAPPSLELKAGAETLEFPVKVGANATPGKHDVYCQVEVPVGGVGVVHQSPVASLRIDKPLPSRVAAAGR